MGEPAGDGWLLTVVGTVTTLLTSTLLIVQPVPLPSWVPGASRLTPVDAPSTRTTAPAPGPRFSVTPGDGQLTVSFAAAADADAYRVDAMNEREDLPAAPCRRVNSDAGRPTDCVVTGLRNGVTYLVSARPHGGQGSGIAVRMVHATPRPQTLGSADLVLWLDPSDSTTIKPDLKGPAGIGSKVLVLRDKSARHADATQPENGFQPTIGQLGPLPALAFSGTKLIAFDAAGLPLSNRPATVLVVAAQDDTNPDASCFRHLLVWGAASANRARIIHKGCRTGLAYAETYGTYLEQNPTKAWPTGRAAVLSAVFDSTGVSVRMNGAASYTWQAGAKSRLDTFNGVGGALGGVPWDLQAGWNGRVGEVLVFERVLSGAELSAVERYLGAKWQVLLAPS